MWDGWWCPIIVTGEKDRDIGVVAEIVDEVGVELVVIDAFEVVDGTTLKFF